MKYLYKILRLFFCPHNYIFYRDYEVIRTYLNGRTEKKYKILTKCKYCGKIRDYKT